MATAGTSEIIVTDDIESADDDSVDRRRRAIIYGALAGLAGVAGVGVAFWPWGDDAATPPTASPATTRQPTATNTPSPIETETDRVPSIIRRYAPDLYFGRRERWFPTDPRRYTSVTDGRTVVDGFDALAGYSREFRSTGGPPRPTVFYRVVPVDDSVVALQYWFYSVFDQFSVNFHWHDWELLQVFVDTQTAAVRLLVASSHARRCPNNEYLHPDLGEAGRPVVLSEVGSHSSATDVNERRPSFERLGVESLNPDVTNGGVRPLDTLSDQPFAYGLPRGEGLGLPYVLPEYEGVSLAEHPALDGVDLDDFMPADVTVRSWGDLARPPSALPTREPGPVLTAPGSQVTGDAIYELQPLEAVRQAIDDFTGPRLSFEFTVPGFAEELYASHITTVQRPWDADRYDEPTADITDPAHRQAIRGESTPGVADRVIGVVSILEGRPGGALDAVDPDDREAIEPFVTVSRFPLPVEVVCLLESDPVAVPTAGGVFRFVDIEPGTHGLVVNGPGIAPVAQRFDHTGGTTRPGADGRVSLVANEDATLLRLDRRNSTGISRLRITETFAGPVFDGQPYEDDRFTVPVHLEGEYTVEIVDQAGVRGVVRVDPRELQGEPIPPFETGKVALARALGSRLEDAAVEARELAADRETDEAVAIPMEFSAAAEDAFQAAEVAAAGEGVRANELLVQVVDRLLEVRRLLRNPESYGYDDGGASVLRHRAAIGVDQAEVAYGTPVVE